MRRRSDYQSGSEEPLRSAIDDIANQLAVAVDGRFEFVVKAALPDATLDKLAMLINFVVEAARRALAECVRATLEVERLRAEWSSVVAHDLRQPVSSISLRAQLLARSNDDATVVKHADRIRADADRLMRMVGDLMDLSRVEAQRLELVRQRVDVLALVRAAVEAFVLLAPDRPFDVRVVGDVPEAWADPHRVTQVLENLMANAVKYGRPGSAVIATIEPDGDDLAVSVASHGRPLGPDEIERVFERFHRTDAAKLEGVDGVGLGLYITRSLVEAHGGRMSAASTPEGVNTFRFTLPATAAAAQ
jgi:signal transduction histidine kinase